MRWMGFLLGVGLSIGSWANEAEPYKPVWTAETSLKKVALTFDDGPKPEHSPPILTILDRFGVRATFFVVGREAGWYPDIVYRMAAAGHEVANHTYSHYRLDTLTPKQMALEISSTTEIIANITGAPVYYFRPPGGRFNRLVLDTVGEMGLTMVMWDVNAGDYTHASPIIDIKGEYDEQSGHRYHKPAGEIVSSILAEVKPGSIILFHNGGEETTKALPDVIIGLREKGYQMVTLTELLVPDSANAFYDRP